MTISDVAKQLGISPHTIRYYEKIGLIKNLEKAGGKRVFTGLDLKWMEFILRLKKTGMPLKRIKQYSDLRYLGDSTITERKNMLIAHKKDMENTIAELQSGLIALDHKLEIYNKMELEYDTLRKRSEKTGRD